MTCCDWQPEAICVAAATMGRDGESAGMCPSGLAEALAGIESISSKWVALVDGARAADPRTVIKRTIRQSATGLNNALLAELKASQSNLSDLQRL